MRIKQISISCIMICLLFYLNLLSVAAADSDSQRKVSMSDLNESNKKSTGETDSQPEVIITELKGNNREIMLTVDIAENSQATSGRIAVYYDGDMLELSEAKEGALWKAEDTNTGLTEDGRKGVSYAWADTQKLTERGNLFTLTFAAKEAANGKEITVETRILELFSVETSIPVKTDRIIDRITVDFGDSNSGGNSTINSGVRTGDEANPAGYVLLGFGAVLVMLDAGKKKG